MGSQVSGKCTEIPIERKKTGKQLTKQEKKIKLGEVTLGKGYYCHGERQYFVMTVRGRGIHLRLLITRES